MQLNSLCSTIFFGRELKECFQPGYDIFITDCYQESHFPVSNPGTEDTLLFESLGLLRRQLNAAHVLLPMAHCYCCSVLHLFSKGFLNRVCIGSLSVYFSLFFLFLSIIDNCLCLARPFFSATLPPSFRFILLRSRV